MRHNLPLGIMRQFVEGGAVPIDLFETRARRRHLHEITSRVVVGTGTADAEVRASGGDQRLRLRLDLTGRWRDHQSSDALRQAVALVGVEDGKALEKRDDARLLARFRSAPTFVLRREAIGIDDGRAPLALPDMAAEPSAWRKVSQLCPEKLPSMTAPHKINTLIPEYPRRVDALRGIASGALIAAVPHG